jgi:hypothetical protein
MLVPDAYQVPGSEKGATHFSPYSYDRHVPLGFYGSVFTPATFHGRVEPVDIAATLASLLGVNQPSASIGHILTQAIHPEVEVKPRRAPLRRRRKAGEASRPARAKAPAEKTPATKTLPPATSQPSGNAAAPPAPVAPPTAPPGPGPQP